MITTAGMDDIPANILNQSVIGYSEISFKTISL